MRKEGGTSGITTEERRGTGRRGKIERKCRGRMARRNEGKKGGAKKKGRKDQTK